MRIRILFYCPSCGSRSFRRSSLRLARDTVWRLIGLHPQRCYMCRGRFYLLNANSVRTVLTVLNGASPIEQKPELEKSRPLITWDILRNNRFW